MLKAWQIFAFSLVPLALVFMGVIGGSLHGVDSAKEVFPTPPPAAAPPPGGAPGGGGPGGPTAVTIVAKDLAFNPRSLSVPANQPVSIVMDNQDAGVSHNFSVYRDNRYANKVFTGDLVTGPIRQPNNFTSPAAGTYYFRCDAHPDTMTGTLNVR